MTNLKWGGLYTYARDTQWCVDTINNGYHITHLVKVIFTHYQVRYLCKCMYASIRSQPRLTNLMLTVYLTRNSLVSFIYFALDHHSRVYGDGEGMGVMNVWRCKRPLCKFVLSQIKYGRLILELSK